MNFVKKSLKGMHLSNNVLAKGANNYRYVASSNMSRLEAHAGFFRLLLKGIFAPYVPLTKC